MYENVPVGLRHAYSLYDRKPKQGITHTCNLPRKVISVDVEGNCMLCSCDAWLPISVTNILDVRHLSDVWRTDLAKKLQDDVDSKKFTWCSVNSCGVMNRDQVRDSHYISINVDESCNLACPSCRISKINWTSGPKYENRLRIAKHLLHLIDGFDDPLEVMMSGNGDPFASLIYRPLLLDMKPKENISLRLLTNGLLIKKLMPHTRMKDNIKFLDISIDAGDKHTYEKVRLGGRWETLRDNLDYVKANFKCPVTLKFVLQKNNLDSLDNFVELVDSYGFSGNIMPIEDWSSMKDFKDHNVLDKNHRLHTKALEKIQAHRTNPNLFFHGI
jgi:MoaA/NifB/PqqE/SkfB family radical SAM enzyme